MGMMIGALLLWMGWIVAGAQSAFLSVDDEQEGRERDVASLSAVEEFRARQANDVPPGGLCGHYTEWVLTPEALAHADVLAGEIDARSLRWE